MWEKMLLTGLVLTFLVALGVFALGTAYEAGMLAGGELDYVGKWPGWKVGEIADLACLFLLFMLGGHDLGKRDARNAMKKEEGRK